MNIGLGTGKGLNCYLKENNLKLIQLFVTFTKNIRNTIQDD